MNVEMLRAIYVGITRAKHHLFICNDTSFLSAQPSIAISLCLRDVWLSYFKDHKEKVLKLRSGDTLHYSNGYLISQQGDYIASLSKTMRNRMEELHQQGYEVTSAQVSYILAWRPREEPQEIAVCLANLVLEQKATPSAAI